MPMFDLGDVHVVQGAIMAGAIFFEIEIIGEGGHGSTPHLCKDPVYTMNKIYSDLIESQQRRIDSANPVVISIPSLRSESVQNNV